MDRILKQSKDVKKTSKVKETKKCETSKQRAKKYSPFKPLAVGVLLATAGVRGVESRQLQGPESLVQKNVTRPFDPPSFTDYLRKIGTSESAIRDVQRRVLAEQRRKLEPVDRVCLDVSASQVEGSAVSSLFDTGLPGVVERVDYSLNVKNRCSKPVENVAYDVTQTSTCPPPANPATDTRKYAYDADPLLVGVGENSGMLGPKHTVAGCETLVNGVPASMGLPSSVKVTVQAIGEIVVDGTITVVSSEKKRY